MPSTAHITCKGPLLLVDSCSPPSLLASADQSCSGNGDALFEERGGLCWQIHHKPRPPTSLSIAQRTSKFSASSTPWLSPAQRTRRGSPALASIHGSHALPAPGLSSCKAEGGTREDPSQHQGAAAAAPPREKTSSAVPDSSRGLNSLKLLFAGAMSAVVSRTCCAPLERLKMEQASELATAYMSVNVPFLRIGGCSCLDTGQLWQQLAEYQRPHWLVITFFKSTAKCSTPVQRVENASTLRTCSPG